LKKVSFILSVLFFSAAAVLSAQSQFFITLTDENSQYSVHMAVKENQEIKSPFAQGKVIKVGKKGSAGDNGLGNHVVIQYDMSFVYEGKKVTQEPVVLVFGNLKEVRVKEGDAIGEEQVLGLTWKEGDPDPGFWIFVLSDTPRNEFLLYKSDKSIKVGKIYYWGPLFLFM
jgi:murein DD-endopeptidase MepM/ murein hydrolase activator NlpD